MTTPPSSSSSFSFSFFCKNPDAIRNNFIIAISLSCLLTIFVVIIFLVKRNNTKRNELINSILLFLIIGILAGLQTINFLNYIPNLTSLPQNISPNQTYTCGTNYNANNIAIITFSLIITQFLSVIFALFIACSTSDKVINTLLGFMVLFGFFYITMYSFMMQYVYKQNGN